MLTLQQAGVVNAVAGGARPACRKLLHIPGSKRRCWMREKTTKCLWQEASTLRQRQHLTVRSDKTVAYVTNNKDSTRRVVPLKLTSDRHEASRGLYLGDRQTDEQMDRPVAWSRSRCRERRLNDKRAVHVHHTMMQRAICQRQPSSSILYSLNYIGLRMHCRPLFSYIHANGKKPEVKVIWHKAPHGGPFPG